MNTQLKIQVSNILALIGLIAVSVSPCWSADRIISTEPTLSATDMQSAIDELCNKRLLFPIQGVDPQTIKGSFYEGRSTSLHHAVDILAARNTPVLATDDGKIAKLWLSKAGGNTIYEIDPSGRYAYYYAHLERYATGLIEGSTVRRGQVIGFVGTSGNAPPNTPHLHFSLSKLIKPGVWWPGASIDPFEVFKGTSFTSTRMAPQMLSPDEVPNLPASPAAESTADHLKRSPPPKLTKPLQPQPKGAPFRI